MIDILIPLADKSYNNFIELKYCLRAIEKYGGFYDKIIIVGGAPEWLQNVFCVTGNDANDAIFGKARNILNKLLIGFNFTEKAIMFNDDFFLLEPTEIERYPYYSPNNSIPEIMDRPNHDAYRQCFIRTARLLTNPFPSFECHRPLLFNKKKFVEKMALLNPNYDHLIRTFYCVKNDIEPCPIKEDLKINNPISYDEIKYKIENQPIFSTGDRAINTHMIKVFEELYPNKSKFEV